MARRGHTSDGKTFCSDCGSSIEPDSERCEHCGEALTDDFKAKLCPYCTTVVSEDVANCTNCGLKLRSEEQKGSRDKEDEEFLSRLLEWGKKLEEKRVQDDEQETEKAADIFKNVVGAISPTPFQEETLKEIRKSAEEKAEFQRREEKLITMAEPLRRALDLRKQALDLLEAKFKSLQTDLEELSEEDLDAEKKRNDIERQLADIMTEKESIRNLEENINNMDLAYRQLLRQHSTEIKEKEDNLNERLAAFKKELERREKEKERLKTREQFLEGKERELNERIDSLKEREASLRGTEERLRQEISALEAERKAIEESRTSTQAAVPAAGDGKWVVDGEELTMILKKSKKAREDWLEEQKKIQEALSGGETVQQAVGESRERLTGREEELRARIQELEERLAAVVSEEGEMRSERTSVLADINRVKKVLKTLDDLLENLPDEVVQKFARSKEFKEYDELMQELDM